MIILGLNAYHGDSSACLVRDGELVAAVEEERFRRVKHWAGFPEEAIRSCLEQAKVGVGDIDHVAVNRRPGAHLVRKALYAFAKRPGLALVKDRISNAAKVREIRESLAFSFQVPESAINARVHHVEHHLAHLGSSFFVSPHDKAALVSVDGFGDFVSTMWGVGHGSEIEVRDRIYFPHSLGLFYLAVTQFLGFPRYGDEYKVMGLAPYGKPSMMDEMRRMVVLEPEGRFILDLDCFLHHSEGVTMTWQDGEPSIGTVYSRQMVDLLGPPRKPGEPLAERHRDIAASVQDMYEEAFIHILKHVFEKTRNSTLCLAGGCAMNSVANGKIFERTGFRDLYIQSAAGDGGGAVGAAYYVWNNEMGRPRSYVMGHAFLGPEFSDDEIRAVLDAAEDDLDAAGCRQELIEDEEELCRKSARRIADGDVVGWFQGRMEWGPRALGNRSIVCDPRRTDMKEILNMKIKRRESFRPFAPSILRGSVGEWFETDCDVPFMLQVYQIREERRGKIPAVTHVNGSGRLQTVTKEQNPRYYRLIREFEKITGVPIVLNTSFNENEPVVCRPREALDCFLRTKMDVLVMGNWFVARGGAREAGE